MFLSRSSKPVTIRKASNPTVGSMVTWNSSGGPASGKIERIVREGTLDVPNSSFRITAEQDDPAVLIRVYRNERPTSVMVGHKMSTLNGVSKMNPNHGKDGRFSSGSKSPSTKIRFTETIDGYATKDGAYKIARRPWAQAWTTGTDYAVYAHTGTATDGYKTYTEIARFPSMREARSHVVALLSTSTEESLP